MTACRGSLPLLVGLWLALWPHAAGARVPLSLEVGAGAGVPLSKFLDGVPLSVGHDVELPFQTVLIDMTNSLGFSASASVLLGQWEIRLNYALLPWDEDEWTHASFRDRPDVYIPARTLQRDQIRTRPQPTAPLQTGQCNRQNLLWPVVLLGGRCVPAANVFDLKDALPLHFVTLGGGYRWYVYEGRLKAYIPAGLGLAMGVIAEVEPLWGFYAQLGFGLEYRVTPRVSAGLSMRFQWLAMSNPESLGGDMGSGAASLAVNQGAFESALETMHLLSIQAYATFDVLH